MNKYPSVAIITGTYNPSIDIFEESLRAARSQIYGGKISHFILDGGSKRRVINMAKKYQCKVMQFGKQAESKTNRLYRALTVLNSDIVLILESDNIMTNEHWISDMVKPFQSRSVFCTFSAYNSYHHNSNLLTKYFALMGSPDPTLYYLGKSDKIRMDQKMYDKGEILKNYPNYYLVRFTPNNMPVMGDNGFMIRTSLLRKVVKDSQPFYHTDAYADLLQMGHDTVGVVKNSIIHVSRSNILEQMKRRVFVKVHFTDEMKGKRKYLVYNPRSAKDVVNLAKYIIFTLTLIEPLYESIRGYFRIRDRAWFIHPLMCLVMVIGYTISEVEYHFKHLFNRWT